MKMLAVLFVACLVWSLCLIPSAPAQTDPFYKGKTVRIVVGFPPGGAVDLWARFIAQYMGRHIPGNPELIVQNMPGGGSMIAANHLYNIAKPDGLTLGMISTALYFNQLTGRKEVQFDWAKWSWIGSPLRNYEILTVRSDTPFKNLEDIRHAPQPPRCGATGVGTTGHYFPSLLEEALGLKTHIVLGYQGTRDIEVAIERGELHCYGITKEVFAREPGRTWLKKGFVRVLVQGGLSRDESMREVPTIYELMEKHKTAEHIKRLALVLTSPSNTGRPMIGPPNLLPERLKPLRDAYAKTLNDRDFLADAKKREWEVEPINGEELEAMAKKATTQPPDTIERLKKILGE
jgi:tripartite-type tricarboxylate transporter receptor subunit TctC